MQCVTFVNQARILTGGRPLDRGCSNTNSKVSVREALIRQKAFTSERESIRSFMVISTLNNLDGIKKVYGNCRVKIFTGLYFTGFNTQILGHLIRSSFYIQFEDLPQRSGQNILLE